MDETKVEKRMDVRKSGASKAKAVTVECHILQKFEKPQVFFLLNDLEEPQLGERIELIEAINKDSKSAKTWNNMLNHVKTYSTKQSEAPGRDRLFRRAQSLIPETCTSEEYLNIWLSYIQEQQLSSGTAERIRSVYEYMHNRKIGALYAEFFENWAEFEKTQGNMEKVDEILEKSKGLAPKSVKPSANTSIESKMGKETSHSKAKTQELPDYIKNFDFKKLQVKKKAAGQPLAVEKDVKSSAPTQSITSNVPEVSRSLKRTGLKATGPLRVLVGESGVSTPTSTSNDDDSDDDLKSPVRPSLLCDMDASLEPVVERSFESSRRDSTSFSGDNHSTTSFDKSCSTVSEEDETLPFDQSSVVTNKTNHFDADETAVVFKDQSKVVHSNKNADETDVIFKCASTPISAIETHGGQGANSSSVTFEAGRGTSQSQKKPVMRKLNKHLDNDSSDEECPSDDDRHKNRRNSSGSECSDPSLGGAFSGVLVNQKKYIKIGTLGKGGSSKVFRVLDGTDGKIYALKRVRVQSEDPKCMKNFINEIQLMESLRNKPCIVQLIDSEIVGRTIHMVMEAGETDLHGVLQRHQEQGSLSANFVRLAWQEMLTAVQVIHDHRIVHGDLKPANFLFVQGHLKLIDFGIAKQINSDTVNITRDVQVGTLNYMSPEAIKDSGGSSEAGKPKMKLGRASDIWSLGCILYQMVYARTPFAHITSFVPKLMAIVDEKHEITFHKLKDKSVVEAIRSCLQRDPNKRPPIAGANGLLKQRFLEPQTTTADTEKSQEKGISVSTIKQIVKRTFEETKAHPSASQEEIESKVLERLKQQVHGLSTSPPQTSPRTMPRVNAAALQQNKTALKDAPVRSQNKENLPVEAKPIGGLKMEIKEQKSKLRSAEDSVANKYQKPKIIIGGDGILSAMQDSSLLLKSGMDRRRQDIMPSEDTMNTACWGAEESWQS